MGAPRNCIGLGRNKVLLLLERCLAEAKHPLHSKEGLLFVRSVVRDDHFVILANNMDVCISTFESQ